MRLIRIAVAAVLALGFQSAYAFHSGGVAECGGCHAMHGRNATATNNGVFGAGTLTTGPSLTRGSDISSTCLNCHENPADTGPSSYHISTADTNMSAVGPRAMTPGGDFAWTKYTYTYNNGRGTASAGGAGHKIVAADYNYVAGVGNSPGGNFPANQLGCGSCHDPHGKDRRLDTGAIANAGAPIVSSGSYNNSLIPAAGQAVGLYRLLNGPSAGFPVPVAVAPSTYNTYETTQQVYVAYGATNTGTGYPVALTANTWGNWCGSCHQEMAPSNTTAVSGHVHPVDRALTAATIANYNSYVFSGNMTGTTTNSYTTLVPFTNSISAASPAAYWDGLRAAATTTGAAIAGPVTSGQGQQVTCLSCHRAHASGFEFALRWWDANEFTTRNGAFVNASGAMQQAFYGRPATTFASYQRVYGCNKCHAQD